MTVLAGAAAIWNSGTIVARVERPETEGYGQKADPVTKTITTDVVALVVMVASAIIPARRRRAEFGTEISTV